MRRKARAVPTVPSQAEVSTVAQKDLHFGLGGVTLFTSFCGLLEMVADVIGVERSSGLRQMRRGGGDVSADDGGWRDVAAQGRVCAPNARRCSIVEELVYWIR